MGVSKNTQPKTRIYKPASPSALTYLTLTELLREKEKRRNKPAENNQKMYSRSTSMTLSIQTTHQESFSFSRMAAVRSTEPEIFTFERIPAAQATAVRSWAPPRPKKRCTRVMYPAKVRMYLPPAEKSPAKRWLLILCLVVLWQIYTEEPCLETPLGSANVPAGDYQVLPFQSAEEQARQLTEASASACESKVTDHGSSSWDQILLNTTCPSPSLETEISRMYEQSTRNGYMVALLVYHRLGSDN